MLRDVCFLKVLSASLVDVSSGNSDSGSTMFICVCLREAFMCTMQNTHSGHIGPISLSVCFAALVLVIQFVLRGLDILF